MNRLVTLRDVDLRDLQAKRAAQEAYLANAARLRDEAAGWLRQGWEGFAAICLRYAYLAEDAAIDESRIDRDELPPVARSPRPRCVDPACRCRLARANDA